MIVSAVVLVPHYEVVVTINGSIYIVLSGLILEEFEI